MIRKYFPLYVISLMLFTQCQKKEVQLPVIDIPGLTEIQNHSSIWIFMDSRKADTIAVLNKNNKILNTHWIFNIDRRLKMDQVIPLLVKMQADRNKDSMHKKEGMNNYFSYADSSSEQICLSSFTEIIYKTSAIIPESDSCSEILVIENGNVNFNGKDIGLDSLDRLKKKIDSCENGNLKKIRLVYKSNTKFQDYLQVKVLLSKEGIQCENIEYLYSVK